MAKTEVSVVKCPTCGEPILHRHHVHARAQLELKPIRSLGLRVKGAYRRFANIADAVAYRFSLPRYLEEANLGVAPSGYAAVAVSHTFISIPVFMALAILFSLLLGSPFPLLLAAGPLVIFVILIYYPRMRASVRADALDIELAALATYSAMAGSAGISTYRVLENVAGKDSPLKACKLEGTEAVKLSALFTKDPLLAMERLSVKHPSRRYRTWLSGLLYVTRTGGDIAKHLEEAADRALQQLEEMWRSFMGAAMDMGNMIMMAYSFVPLLVFVLVTIFTSNIPNYALLFLYIFIASPLVTVVMVLVVERLIPSSPAEVSIFYLRAVPWILVGAAVGALLLFWGGAKPYVALAAGIVAFTAPACIPFEVTSHEERSVERYLPEFLADVTESKRIGQELERSIPQISRVARYSQPLNRIVKILATNIEIGAPIPRAIEVAMARLRGWFGKVVFFLLQEAFLTGGGTTVMFERLAKFTRTYVETRRGIMRSLRTHIAMYYVTAVIVIAAVVLVLRFALLPQSALFGQLTGGFIPTIAPSPEQVRDLISLVMVGVVLNSFELGLLAGKVAEGSLAAGLKHCAAATAITLASFAFAGLL